MKNKKGITLLALVITIILLLILAAVTLNLTLGENGMIQKALYAKEEYLNASKKENEQLENLYSQMKIATNGDITVNIEELKNVIKEELKQEMKESNLKNPTGTIISYMGNTAPEGYLFCNGATYQIGEYKELAEQIKKEFGSYNYWGGDGETTFALPDLRGEFLRGTGTATRNTGSGVTVGVHQDGTWHAMTTTSTDNTSGFHWIGGFVGSQALGPSTTRNQDLSKGSSIGFSQTTESYSFINREAAYCGKPVAYTSRPTNTSVLYCIKY